MYKLYGGIIQRFFELKKRYFKLWFDYCKLQEGCAKKMFRHSPLDNLFNRYT